LPLVLNDSRAAKSFGETARSGRSVPPDEPAQPEKRVKG